MVVSTSNVVEMFVVRRETCDKLSRSVGQIDRKYGGYLAYRMYKNKQETPSNRRIIVPCKEIVAKESNSGVKIFTGNS